MVGVALAGTPSRCPRAQVASTDRAFVLSLMTDRPRGLARVWEDYCARPYRVKYSFLRIYIYIPPQHERGCPAVAPTTWT
jgi:hypothetical protein